MSSKLKPVDLTGAVVGSGGVIDFNQFSKFAPNDISQKAHLRILNESGCGLDIVFQASGNSHNLPAGGWGTFDIEPNDGQVTVTVTYILPNPPVSKVFGMYYRPGESVPAAFTLGNSPIGIGGSISVSSIQQLINDGSVAGTQILESTVTGDATSTTTLTNDGKLKLGDIAHPGLLTFGGSAPTTTDPTLANNGLGELQLRTAIGLIMQTAGTDVQFTGGIDPVLAPVAVSGTAGTASVYQFFQGTIKAALVTWTGFKNTAAQNLVLPQAFTSGAMFWIGETQAGTFTFLSLGGAIICSVLTSLASTGGGQSAVTNIKQWSQGMTRGGFDTVQLLYNSGTAASGLAFFIGI